MSQGIVRAHFSSILMEIVSKNDSQHLIVFKESVQGARQVVIFYSFCFTIFREDIN